jgi:threonine/homoserine/homoserine lactone efflux protein
MMSIHMVYLGGCSWKTRREEAHGERRRAYGIYRRGAIEFSSPIFVLFVLAFLAPNP